MTPDRRRSSGATALARLAERLEPRWAYGMGLVILSALALAEAASSLRWRMVHDAPLMVYPAFLTERLGWVPYRDFFDINAPGTQLLHRLLFKVFGASDLGFRVSDLSVLSITLIATFTALRPIDWRAAWAAPALWTLVYLSCGPGCGLQREEVVIAFLALALAVVLAAAWSLRWRATALGLLFGLATSIKPHAALGLPVLLWYAIAGAAEPAHARDRWRAAAGTCATAAVAFVAPLLLLLAYLGAIGALPAFLEMAREYWPLYGRLSGAHATIQSPLFNLYSGYRKFGRIGWWLAPAIMGVATAIASGRATPESKRAVRMLAGLTLVYVAYVAVPAKFFGYHWHPFHYLLTILCALALVDLGPSIGPAWRHAPALLLAVFLARSVTLSSEFKADLQGQPPQPIKSGRVDELAAFLKARLRPGDTVQPLDWTGGVLQGMLVAKAEIATPFLYDYLFYHHVSDHFIADLRGRFLEALRARPPRFVIEVTADDKPFVRGKDTTRDFNKLRRFLEQNYAKVEERNGYVIYELRPPHAQ